MTQKTLKRNNIIPNETMWCTSRKAKDFLSGKEFTLCSTDEQVTLPSGFRRSYGGILNSVESLIPELNKFDFAKFERTVILRFECDGAIPASSLKTPGKLVSELKNVKNGRAGGFRRKFDGSPLEIGDVIDGTFKHAIDKCEEMSIPQRVTKYHPHFDCDVSGRCDGMFGNRPIEVKTVASLSENYVHYSLENNNLQFAAYNWLYGELPLIIIISRDNLMVDVIEPVHEMVEPAMAIWETWK